MRCLLFRMLRDLITPDRETDEESVGASVEKKHLPGRGRAKRSKGDNSPEPKKKKVSK